MTDVNDLVTWLREQIAEDRAAALAARAEWGDEDGDRDSDWEEWRLSLKLADAGWFDPEPRGLDRHWQLHSPRAVLAQCDAHEAIMAAHETAEAFRQMLVDNFTRDLRQIAALDADEQRHRYSAVSKAEGLVSGYGIAVRMTASAYRHRPGYREEWRA